jgi:uncharacterized protein YyaL (SSP411 family)
MPNRLAAETSPYLRQHADNPVDWYPWGEEAFAAARERDRPLLVSIGYSACHWCHVMAHESFEDPATAAVMNDLFVNVKVDREERPDVDAVYMEATQAMTGSGGWPMTVFATPDGRPFFCGTYFPPRSVPGRRGFADLCHAVDQAWREQRDDLLEQAGHVTEALGSTHATAGEAPDAGVVTNAVENLLALHDPEWGGFGSAPKFPQAMAIDVLLRHHARAGSAAALHAAVATLDAMAAGGIYDHLGGGFSRYSVDPVWLVPHFEKMLYDQALLLRPYLHAWQLTGEARHLQVVEETIGYLQRDLRQPDGAYASAEDADSEGEEGRFYLWTPAQVSEALADDPDLAAAAIGWWNVTEAGNFEARTILNRMHHRGDLQRPENIEAARQRLLEARARRVRPGLDDKVLTEWNALLVASLAEAGAAAHRPDWIEAAVTTATFLLGHLRDDQGRWLRSWQADSGARHLAFAADHAALVDAFTRLAEATGEARWITEARATADALLDRFEDPADGGVFTTAHDGEQLITRPKDLQDNPIPSANSAAAVALLRLGALTGAERYTTAAQRILALTGRFAGQYPTGFGHLLAAVDLDTAGITEVVVAGPAPELLATVRAAWRPGSVVAWGEPYASPLWEGREPTPEAPARAYVCRDFTCDLPTADPTQLAAQLTSG